MTMQRHEISTTVGLSFCGARMHGPRFLADTPSTVILNPPFRVKDPGISACPGSPLCGPSSQAQAGAPTPRISHANEKGPSPRQTASGLRRTTRGRPFGISWLRRSGVHLFGWAGRPIPTQDDKLKGGCGECEVGAQRTESWLPRPAPFLSAGSAGRGDLRQGTGAAALSLAVPMGV
jgi:hypothetical protein